MKRFRFRLQTLLEVKKRKEEELEIQLAEKNGKIIQTRKQLQEGCDRLSQFQAAEKCQRNASANALMLRLSVLYRHTLQRDIDEKNRRITGLKRDVQAVLQSLTEAKKETKTLNILKGKKLAQWKKDATRQEQEFIDDISQKGYIRKAKNAATHNGDSLLLL